MSEMRKLCLYVLAGCFLAVAIGSCQNKKAKQGKFSEAQMAEFALAERQDLPAPSGGLVLSINKEAVTADEIISPLMDTLEPMAAGGNFQRFTLQARGLVAQTVMSRTTDVLLYQQAKKQSADSINEDALDKAAQAEVNRFVANYGGNVAEANKAIQKMGMGWPQLRDYQKRLLLTQYYISQELGDREPVTHSELLDKYNEMKDEHFSQTGQIRFRLIDIAINKIEAGEPGTGAAKEAALKLAQELTERIRGGEDFGELAKTYSNDAPHRVAEGGLWAPVTPGSLAAPHDVLENVAQQMEPGDVSGPIEAKGHIFIMKLESKRKADSEPFENVQAQIEAQILFQRQKAALDAMIEKLIRQANIADMDTFVNFCIETAYRRITKTRQNR
jgi:peptidyl-prolyl cis-trans isomerase SurA